MRGHVKKKGGVGGEEGKEERSTPPGFRNAPRFNEEHGKPAFSTKTWIAIKKIDTWNCARVN